VPDPEINRQLTARTCPDGAGVVIYLSLRAPAPLYGAAGVSRRGSGRRPPLLAFTEQRPQRDGYSARLCDLLGSERLVPIDM